MLNHYFNRFFLPFSLFFIFGFQAIAQTGAVKGFLYDKKTGEPVIFTNVLLKGTSYGIATDVNGYFAITKVPAGKYVLSTSSIGYETLEKPIELTPGQELKLKLYITEVSRELQEVEVTGSRDKTARLTTVNASISRITPKEIKTLPSVGGARDLAQYLQTIPGIVFTGDQGGQLYIRGGLPVQNLTLLDGMMVYNPFHSIGLFSIFETDILKNVDVYTASFPADYGGRASSVIDIKTIDGNKNKPSVKAGINPFTANVQYDGPLYRDSASGFAITNVFSYRTSYLDKTSKSIYSGFSEQLRNGLPFSFNDFYGKATFHLGGGNKISIFGMYNDDKAGLGGLSNFEWKQSGYGANFLLLPSGTSTIIDATMAFSRYDLGISETTTTPRSSNVSGMNTNINFTYFNNKDEMKYGLGLVTNNTSFVGVTPNLIKQDAQNFNTEIFTYFKYKIVAGDFIIDPGVRLHGYVSLGNFSLEPRLGMKYSPSKSLRFKAAVGRYSQNLISTQSDRDVVGLFQGFLSSPDGVYDRNVDINSNSPIRNNLQLANHAVIGAEIDLNEYLEITVEPYVKQFQQFININTTKIFQNQPNFIKESGVSYGIDFLAKYDYKTLFLQAGYSLSRSTREFEGIEYAPIFDRRHNLNLLGTYRFGRENTWEFSARWNLGSGFPFTQTIAFYENFQFPGGIDAGVPNQNGDLGIYYGDLNNFNRGRLPYYHRLDLSVKKKFYFGKNMKLEIDASCINTYNRANLFYFDRVAYKRVNQLPFLPALGLNFEF